mmetsp:Transcript_124/g.440  ORF Transcript_124/g.440 Transcript_124/m.440 type:complete len:252 (+) Transcript_124:103-858(+)
MYPGDPFPSCLSAAEGRYHLEGEAHAPWLDAERLLASQSELEAGGQRPAGDGAQATWPLEGRLQLGTGWGDCAGSRVGGGPLDVEVGGGPLYAGARAPFRAEVRPSACLGLEGSWAGCLASQDVGGPPEAEDGSRPLRAEDDAPFHAEARPSGHSPGAVGSERAQGARSTGGEESARSGGGPCRVSPSGLEGPHSGGSDLPAFICLQCKKAECRHGVRCNTRRCKFCHCRVPPDSSLPPPPRHSHRRRNRR